MLKNFKNKNNSNGFDKNPQNAKHTGRPRKFVSTVIQELTLRSEEHTSELQSQR